MPAYSAVLDRALAMAAQAHQQQVRKGSSIPYFVHPAHAAIILIKYAFPEEAVVAAVLHDIVEDTEVTLELLQAEFGPVVAQTVAQVSEQKHAEGAPGQPVSGELLPWRVRKQEQLDRLAQADRLAAAVKCADALHNCRSTLNDLAQQGSGLWGRFRGSPADQLWYYSSLATVLRQRLGDHPLCDELAAAVAELAKFVPQ